MPSWILHFAIGVATLNIVAIIMDRVFNHPFDMPTALVVMVTLILSHFADKNYQAKKNN